MLPIQTNYRNLIKDAVKRCDDLELLDLAYKLLLINQKEQDLESWKPIEGYEGLYEVSDQGRVRSLRKDIILKPSTPDKYWSYKRVYLCNEGKQVTIGVHRLVAQAFIPNPESKSQVNHINGDKTDNRALNLEWVSASTNIKHSYLLGRRTLKGREAKKLTKDQIEKIKQLYDAGKSKREIMSIFKVSWSTIHRYTSKKEE